MGIFNNKKVHLLMVIFIVIGISFSIYYFNYVSEKKTSMQMLNYQRQAQGMQARVAQMIYEKQRATTAVGLVLVQNSDLIKNIKNRTINDTFYKSLTKKLRENTEYKNIWVNIIDNKLNSVYRSWTDKTGDNLKNVRDDVIEVIKTQKITYTISSGKFTVDIKAIIPVLEDDEVVGVLEIISHFNSIDIALKDMQIESVVMLNKKDSQKLQYPFTEKFLDGYYIANFAAPQDKLEYLQKKGIENYFNTNYKIENGYLITAFPLISFDGSVLGYYIMFKYLNNISSTDEDFFVFKLVAIGFIVILLLGMTLNITLVYVLARQKAYIKNIIDSSTNIVVINDRMQILDVNTAFFKYFSNEKSLEEFKKRHNCICEFFIEEQGYISKYVDGELWIDYLLQHHDQTNKVKIDYDGQIYYFNVNASMILPEKGYHSIVFSDITKEEMYKLELEKLAITDALTGVGNRRYYNLQIEEHLSLAKRYKFPLSLIMIDIDHFKQVNDKHGHGVGDMVLIEYSKLISSAIREADILCRVGGEEFVVIVPNTNLEQAEIFAQKLRKMVAEHKVVLPITISIGLTEYIQGEDAEHILTRVDEALYEAKENGRDQVVCK